jgi:AcrR family transcriptional regulator
VRTAKETRSAKIVLTLARLNVTCVPIGMFVTLRFVLDVKNKIKEAVKQIIKADSSGKVSISEVARIAGISRQTIYRHVGGKEKFDELIGKKRSFSDDTIEKSRDRILAAAYKTIARFGYTAATIDRIAAEAGLTKGAVYWHFENKKELFLAILEKRLTHRLEEYPKYAISAVQSADALPGLAAMLSDQISFAMFDPDWQKLYLSYLLQGQDNSIKKRLQELSSVLLNSGAALLAKMQKDGFLDPSIDTRALAVIWIAVLDGLVLAWLRSPNAIDYASIAPQLAQVLWEGIKRRD